MSLPGRAFTAPRKQSLDRARSNCDDSDDLEQGPAVRQASRANSVRAARTNMIGRTYSFNTPPSKRKGRVFGAADADEISRRLQLMRNDSVGSTKTNHSYKRGRKSATHSPAVGFYLQPKAVRPQNSLEGQVAKSASGSSQASMDRRAPAALPRGREASHRDRGKSRALDW